MAQIKFFLQFLKLIITSLVNVKKDKFHFRYCGVRCQEKDWAVHKNYCKERRSSHAYASVRSSHFSEHMDSCDSPER